MQTPILKNIDCASSVNNKITFSKVIVDINDKEELDCYLEDGICPQLLDGKILWEEMCGSSYADALGLGFHDSMPDNYPNMVTMPPQDALHSVDDIKKQCPTIEGDVYIKQYVNPDKYQIILFVNAENPSIWYGFIALNHQESLDQSAFSLHAILEMVYVRPEFRGIMLGAVMAREVGRLLSEQCASRVEKHEESLTDVYVSVIGQGVTPAGRRCLEEFNDGLAMHLDDSSFEDIEMHYSLEDEY